VSWCHERTHERSDDQRQERSRERRRALLTVLLGSMLPCALPFASAQQSGYEKSVVSTDGIGKRYMGREIAAVMGWQGASWLERLEREREERTDLLIKDLRLAPAMTIADIGAGTGYLSRRMAQQIGSSGVVLAVDVQPEMIRLLESQIRANSISNIKPVLGQVDQINLAKASVDLAIMVDVYHELEYPYEMIISIIDSLKPGGQLVLVEYRAEDPRVPIKEVHKMSEAQVRKELAVHPALTWERTGKTLPWQHVIVFRKRS
jgi:precorrin-6B methylase 2